MIWHTHSEHAGTFTSAAVSNWEMAIAKLKLHSLTRSRQIDGQFIVKITNVYAIYKNRD